MNTPVKAIFFDIDGTLINHSGGPFTDDLEAMNEAVKAGHKLFINTGRSLGNIPERVLNLPFWSGVAAGGGAHVLVADSRNGSAEKPAYRTIYHKWIEKKLLAEISAWYLKEDKFLILEGEHECYIIGHSERTFTVRPSIRIKRADDFEKLYPDEFITKLTLRGALTEAEQSLLAGFTANVFPDYAEAILKGETKAGGLQIALDAAGIAREHSVALGDSVNDLDMIRYAGLGVAMGNAAAELKAVADAITNACGEGGAARMLRDFVL